MFSTKHSGLPSAPPKGFTLQPDLLFLHRQKKVGKKTLVRKMLPPTGIRTPRFSDLPSRLYGYNQLIFNHLLLKRPPRLTALAGRALPATADRFFQSIKKESQLRTVKKSKKV